MTQNADDLHTNEYNLPDGRAVITRRINTPTGAVWSVLADGWLYAAWVVGASRVRMVEPDWPTPGSRLHHSFGIWPALINDHTEVLDADLGRELLLKARGWPAGEATVRIRVTPASTRDTSTISIVEDATSGPGTLLPRSARQLLIAPRNKEAIRRLAFIAEGRHRQHILDAQTKVDRIGRVS